MKLSYILLLASTFCFCSNTSSQLEEKLQIKTFVKGVYDVPRDRTGKTFFMIGLKLKNISDSPVEFLTMTCTTGSNVVFDSNLLEPVINNCASNFSTPIVLKQNQEFDFTFLLSAKGSYPDRLKIGWIVLTKENTPNASEYYDYLNKFRKNLEHVIWATPIELYCCAFNQFEIK
jgi:hypothetical protein